MSEQHFCSVCFLASHEHDDAEFWPARCCYGCGCGEERPADEDGLAEPTTKETP